MRKRSRRVGVRSAARVLAALVVAWGAARAAAAPVLRQVNDFEDGTTQGWATGGPSPFPVTNDTGGPAGAADHFIRFQSSGEGSAGSKLVMFHTGAQWTGSYPATIQAIEMDLKSFGAEPLAIRVTIRGTNGDQFSSANAFALAADGQWHRARFDLSDATLTPLFATGTVASVLAGGLAEVRLLHAGAPAYAGDTVAANVGVDNVTAAGAVPEPGALGLVGIGIGGVLSARRGRRGHGGAARG